MTQGDDYYGMTTWSCSMFYNEVDILEIRLAELCDVVDIFVLVEATSTHMGKPRELVYPQYEDTRFFPWRDQIRYIPIAFPEGMGDWERENYQREQAGIGLRGLQPDDLVIISDLDEILSAETVRRAQRGEIPVPCNLSFPIHPYRLDWQWDVLQDGFNRCTIVYGSELTEIPGVGFAGVHGAMRHHNAIGRPGRVGLVGDYGWHFTYIGDEERIVDKSYSIADEWVKGLATQETARAAIEQGIDIFGRDDRPSHRVALESLPVYVQQNPQRFAHILGAT